jgi:hypothetical protein
MNAFFKPVYGTDLIVSGLAGPTYLLNLKTGKSFDIPNNGSDPGASPDGEFVTLLGFEGLAWFSTADILAGKPNGLLKDPGLKTYQSMGLPAPGRHRVLGAVTSSSNPAALIVRDYERSIRADGGATVTPVTEWRTLCDGKKISIPMMSKTGRFLSGSHDGTMKVFRIGQNASECEEVFDSKLIGGKADFSIDDRSLVYVSQTRDTNGRSVGAVFLSDILNQTSKPIYFAAEETQLAFPGFSSVDRIVVHDQTSTQLIQIDRVRRIED